MAQIKICGLRRIGDIKAANAFLPDYIGFVFAKSKRQVTPEQAAALREHLSPQVKAVGVFVNLETESLADIALKCRLAAVQLHGDEDTEYIKALRRLLPEDVEIWKAVRVQSAGDITKANEFEVDKLVFDACSKGAYGGTGRVFDWSLLQAEIQKPYFVAGGISMENVKEVIARLNPYGVDLSSGVETDGYKDPVKMTEIIRIIHKDGRKTN